MTELPTTASNSVPGAQPRQSLSKELPRVAHIVPYDGLGGVETAVRSMEAGDNGCILLHKCFISKSERSHRDDRYEHHGASKSEYSLGNYWAGYRYLRATKPDIIIASLWRSVILMGLASFLGVRGSKIVFLHLPRSIHAADFVLNLAAMIFSHRIWTDSDATLEQRVPRTLRWKARTISFLTRTVSHKTATSPAPKFIFWGRINAQKGLDRAIRIFATIRRHYPLAEFTVIGQDRGGLKGLQTLCDSLQIGSAVRFLGARDWNGIAAEAASHSFYLQTSNFEGMALSVIEAMQMGLVPIVTPAGEIGNYCRDGVNAIIVKEDQEAAEKVLALLADGERFKSMAQSAQSEWAGVTSYRDSVLSACQEALGRQNRHAGVGPT